MIYLDGNKEIKKIVSKCFPSYNGKKFKLSTNIPSQLNSYWSGGSKDNFVFYELSTEKIYDVLSNHPYFEKNNPRDLKELPRGLLIVKHSIYMGKDEGITIYANKEDLTPMLPNKIELTNDERTVLYYTRSYKSSYAGIKNYRFHEANRITGITLERWDKAKEDLIERKLLNKRGAITNNGRNAVERS